MHTTNRPAQERENRLLDIICRRLDLSAEARGTIDRGRSIRVIRAEQADVEAEASAFEAEHGFALSHPVPV